MSVHILNSLMSAFTLDAVPAAVLALDLLGASVGVVLLAAETRLTDEDAPCGGAGASARRPTRS